MINLKKLQYLFLTKIVGFLLNVLVIFRSKLAAKIAYGLHSKPQVGKLQLDSLPTILQSAIKNTLKVDEYIYQTYTWVGTIDIILLVHGWESNSSRWEKLIPYLQKTKKTIIAIDAPAHGLSSDDSFSVPKYAKVIGEFAKTIKIDYLIGHSIGGASCILYQFKNQNTGIKKMVILGAPSDLRVLIDNFVGLLSLSNYLKKHLTKEFEDNVGFAVNDFSAEKFASKIATPALIVHDKHDAIVNFAESQKTIKNWKNATFLATKNLGHSMHDHDLYTRIREYIE